MFKIEYLEVFKNFFIVENKCLVIPDLWSNPDWDDENYINYISSCVATNYHTDRFSPTFLYVKDKILFTYLRALKFFSIFTALDISDKRIPLNCMNEFYLSNLYNEVEDNLIFVGWNPRCSIGSAIMDGYYPISLIDNANGRKIIINDTDISINKFGLLENEDECKYICYLNNLDSDYNEGDYWYPTKLYVDKFTYERINIFN